MSRFKCMTYPDLNNGPGCRVSFWFTGCPIQCEGCFNSELWDFNSGNEITEDTFKKLESILDLKYISGLTILGGEPMVQDKEILKRMIIMAKIRNKNVWLYTGFNYDTFTEEQKKIIMGVDVIVDGPFIKAQADPNLKFRGSRNQRIIELNK